MTGSPPRRLALRAPLAVALAAVALSGCGRGDDRAQARAVTERFFAALERDDGERACALLSPDTRAEVQSQEEKPCREAITGLGLEGARVTRLQVFVGNAKADLADGESVFLGSTPRGWRVSAAGCSPLAGKPADRPFDCTVQA